MPLEAHKTPKDCWLNPHFITNPLVEKPINSGSFSQIFHEITINFWLVVWTPLKNISQLGWLFSIYGKIKNCSKPPTKISITSPFLFLVKAPSSHHKKTSWHHRVLVTQNYPMVEIIIVWCLYKSCQIHHVKTSSWKQNHTSQKTFINMYIYIYRHT